MEYWKNKNIENLSEIVDGVVYLEEWKDVPNYEGLYQVSTFGRVKTYGNRYNGNKVAILALRLDVYGYAIVNVYKNGMKTVKVHRLVAMAFIPNTDNKKEVNHKNGVRNYNKVTNLEWVTCSENMQHRIDVLGTRINNLKPQIGEKNYQSKAVVCTTLDIYSPCMLEMSKMVGVSKYLMQQVLIGKKVHVDGLVFRFK